ncbi:MAG: hypothetical protein P8K77_05375 [Polaribacter sp.]|nr:hypothetical protein [Polaribacter sp.]
MKNILSIIMLMSCFVLQSQVYDNSFNPSAESIRMARTPNSPEAQAFTKYGNTPVNMYSGTPNLQIPIYTHKGRELDLPISLTYDASGVKVEQLATNVGLSWNLNVGGRISRIINGLPDDFYPGYTTIPYKSLWDDDLNQLIKNYKDVSTSPLFDTQPLLLDYMVFLKKAKDNEYDIQPDYFSFNALGQSDTFVIDIESRTPKPLDNPRNKISIYKPINGANSPIQSWVVTADDGTIYTFESVEITKDINLDDSGPQSFYGYKKEYNSSWLLTKVESANGKDVYDFTYTDLGHWTNNRGAATFVGVTNALGINCSNNNVSPTNSMGYTGSNEYTIQQKVISEISHNGKRIVSFNLSSKRWDMDVNSAIEKIHIYNADTNNHTNDLYKSFEFKYDYFRTYTSPAPPYSTASGNVPNMLEVRLKLDAIEIKDNNETFVKKYSFNYNNPYSLSSTASMSQDYYGYNNGASNQYMFPTYSSACIPNDGGDRNPNFTNASKGMLTKITYPTGGHTEFEYESNYEREYVGSNTIWNTVSSTSLNFPTMGSFDPLACSAVVGSSTYTPANTSDVFEVTQNDVYKLTYNQSGTIIKWFETGHMAFLVKIPSQSATLSWAGIYDNNCDTKPGVDIVWSADPWNYDNGGIWNTSTTMTLDVGFYQLVLANPSSNLTNSLIAQKAAAEPNYVFNVKAGIRVKSIKDYTDATTLATHKSYEYPSGTVISEPRLTYITNQFAYDTNGQIIETPILHRMSSASGTGKPHIGYSEVIEKVISVSNPDSNGSTSHRFYTDISGNYHTGVYTYYINGKETANQYGVDYHLGKSSGNTTYNKDDVTITDSSNNYYDESIYSNTGLYLYTDESKSEMFPIPTQFTSGKWGLSHVPGTLIPVMQSVTFGGTGGVSVQTPTECNSTNFLNYNIGDLCTTGIGRLSKQKASAWGKVGGMITSSSNQYFNSSDIVSQITNYSYYKDTTMVVTPNKPAVLVQGNHLLKATSTVNSKGESLKKEYLYLDQVSSGTGSLSSSNILTIPLETKIFKNNNLMSHKKTHYIGTLPSKIQTSKGANSLEDRVLFERFEDNNLVQAKQVGGSSTAYIWGYDNRYIVAKVENATYSDIENLTNFSPGFTITTNLTTNQLNDLRAMSNVLVTTFEYDPVVGVTKITDPRGNDIFYEYDDFNRLLFVKDHDGKILSKNEYNYKN